MRPTEVEAAVIIMDTDNDGKVTLPEFQAWWSKSAVPEIVWFLGSMSAWNFEEFFPRFFFLCECFFFRFPRLFAVRSIKRHGGWIHGLSDSLFETCHFYVHQGWWQQRRQFTSSRAIHIFFNRVMICRFTRWWSTDSPQVHELIEVLRQARTRGGRGLYPPQSIRY